MFDINFHFSFIIITNINAKIKISHLHCVKSLQMLRFFKSKYEKVRTRKQSVFRYI